MIRVKTIFLFLMCLLCYGQEEIDSLNTIEQVIQADSTKELIDLSIKVANVDVVGDVITYAITVSNGGPLNATSVEVFHAIPDGLTVQNVSISTGIYSSFTSNWFVGDVAVGVDETLSIEVIAANGGDFVNIAQVSSADQLDIDSTPNNDDGDQSEDDEDSALVTWSNGSLQFFSLQEAKDYALKNNLNVKMKKTDGAMAKEQMREIRATGLPQVGANMNYNRFFQLPTSLVPANEFGNPEAPDDEFLELQFGTKNTVGFSLDANQLIFSGSYLTALEAGKEFASLRSEEVIQSEEQVKFAVSQAYYNVLLAKAQIEILDKNKSNLEQILFETSQLYENGFIEMLDVDRLTLSLSNINIQIVTTKRSLYVAKEFLKFQMGYTEEEDIELSDGLNEILPEIENVVIDDSDVFNPRKRIEYRLLDRQKLLTELDIKNVKWQGYPSLAAFASYQQNWQQNQMKEIFNSNFWFPTFVVGLQLNIPIFSGFRGSANIEQKKLQIVQINQMQSLMKQSFNLELNQTRIEYLSSLEQLNSQRENISLAEKIYNTSVIKYKEGLGSSLEVNAAESELFQTQGLYLQSLYNLLIAKTNLDKANGKF